jgi:hypothetical protein
MPFEADDESADPLTASHDNRRIAGVGMGAIRANRYDGIVRRPRTWTVCGHGEARTQSGRENRAELVEGPPTDLDLEEDAGDGLGEPLRIPIGGQALWRGSAASLFVTCSLCVPVRREQGRMARESTPGDLIGAGGAR